MRQISYRRFRGTCRRHGYIKEQNGRILKRSTLFTDAITAYTDGAVTLNNGIGTLNNGIGSLKSGIDTLADNVPALVSGVGQLKAGTTVQQTGQRTLQPELPGKRWCDQLAGTIQGMGSMLEASKQGVKDNFTNTAGMDYDTAKANRGGIKRCTGKLRDRH